MRSAGERSPAHSAPIIGLAVDACNRRLLSVCQQGNVHAWDFKQFKMVDKLPLPCGAHLLDVHAHSQLAAVACSDMAVRVIDAQRARIVRHFVGHRDRLTALCVSADSQWVISSSLDGTVRVWDVPAAACLQTLRLGSQVVTGVSLAPGGELLATTHRGCRGVYLWSNRKLFGAAGAITPSDGIVDAHLPTVATGNTLAQQRASALADAQIDGAAATGALSSDDSDADESALTRAPSEAAEEAAGERVLAQQGAADAAGRPRALQRGLLTLSGQPASSWESLVHLDAIKVRHAAAPSRCSGWHAESSVCSSA